jgi:hypothetical protein
MLAFLLNFASMEQPGPLTPARQKAVSTAGIQGSVD